MVGTKYDFLVFFVRLCSVPRLFVCDWWISFCCDRRKTRPRQLGPMRMRLSFSPAKKQEGLRWAQMMNKTEESVNNTKERERKRERKRKERFLSASPRERTHSPRTCSLANASPPFLRPPSSVLFMLPLSCPCPMDGWLAHADPPSPMPCHAVDSTRLSPSASGYHSSFCADTVNSRCRSHGSSQHSSLEGGVNSVM